MDFIFIYVLIGLIFSLAGLALKLFPPKNINALYGYRTTLSMSDQRYWNFSQRYSARLMIAGGLTIIVIGFVLKLFNLNITTGVVICLTLVLMKVVLLFILTERAIKNKFNLRKNSVDA